MKRIDESLKKMMKESHSLLFLLSKSEQQHRRAEGEAESKKRKLDNPMIRASPRLIAGDASSHCCEGVPTCMTYGSWPSGILYLLVIIANY